jgi:2-polyprenyl-3-methyl-5-hydroxy-6-metoxy-1,4-benzoquinol methylase
MAGCNRWDLVAKAHDQKMGREGGKHHRGSLVPAILGYIGDVRGKRVLDLACGQGYLTQILAESGAVVTGVDLSIELLKIARKNEEERKNGVEYLHRDAADLQGIDSGTFDIIVCNMALHDIGNLQATMNECGRVLRPGGLFVFSILHPIADGLKSGEAEKDFIGSFVRLRHYKKTCELPHRAYRAFGISLHHRPLDAYLNGLFAAGFSVRGFREIPAEQDSELAGASLPKRVLIFVKGLVLPGRKEPARRPPSWLVELWDEIPLFAVVAARKE